MSKVFVVDTSQRPLDPVHPGRARMLLTQGKAAVWRRFPFTIILHGEVQEPEVQPLRLKLDPEGTQDIAVVLKKKPEVLKRIENQAKTPLKDAAAVNTTRWALLEKLKAIGLPVECASGGLTKWNRSSRGFPKTHWLDAANVGKSTPALLTIKGVVPLLITATGHGSRQMCVTDALGFPKQHKKRQRTFQGYRTGDIVKAVTPKGTYQGRIAIRHRPSFRLGKVDIHTKYIRRVQRADGYQYEKGVVAFHPHV